MKQVLRLFFQRMGDKTEARRIAEEVGVPVVPGLGEAVLEFDKVK